MVRPIEVWVSSGDIAGSNGLTARPVGVSRWAEALFCSEASETAQVRVRIGRAYSSLSAQGVWAVAKSEPRWTAKGTQAFQDAPAWCLPGRLRSLHQHCCQHLLSNRRSGGWRWGSR